MPLPDTSHDDDLSSSGPGEVELQRLRSAKLMRKQNLTAYAESFSVPSIIDPKTAPKLSIQQRLYLRAYDRLLQKFLHAHTMLSRKKQRREEESIGFQFPLPDPDVTKEDFLRIMRTIAGEGGYAGYERALQFEQRNQGFRSTESLIVGNEEVF